MNKKEDQPVILFTCGKPDRNGVIIPEDVLRKALDKGVRFNVGEVLFEDESNLRDWRRIVEERVGVRFSDLKLCNGQVTGKVCFEGPRSDAARQMLQSQQGTFAIRAAIIKDHTEVVTEIPQILSFDLVNKEPM
jgi:hypothetical protein